MRYAKILSTYALRNKKDNIARVFKRRSEVTHEKHGEIYHKEMIDHYEVWWHGSMIYRLGCLFGDARPRALGLADGINHFHVLGAKGWPIEELH